MAEIRRYTALLRLCEQYFYDWMYDEVDVKKLETNILSKIYFLGFIIKEKNDRLKIIDDMIQKTEKVRDELAGYSQMLNTLELNAYEKESAFYQLKTLDYGVMSHDTALEWLKKLREA